LLKNVTKTEIISGVYNMDAVREQLNRPLVAGIVGFIAGLLIGWFLLGYALFPVQWVDAGPGDLQEGYQEVFLRMSIHTYVRTNNAAEARQRWAELGEQAPELLQNIAAQPAGLTPQDIQAFQMAVGAQPAPSPAEPQITPPLAEEEPETGGFLRFLLPFLCLITVLLGGAILAVMLMRGRGTETRPATPAMQAHDAARDAEWTDYAAIGEEPPMAQFMASYKLGDDLFDDSFSIDSPSGEFLGECGVGISETIGVGDPKKVSAFEVWLFDKNDIQTVTKVLMSSHAFADDVIRQRLAAKGEPVQAHSGGQIVLETATLQLVARVVDAAYGEGPLPEDSFFDSMLLELAVWQK
jgi:hypothetical protein